VHDLVFPFGWYLLSHRGLCKGHNSFDFAAETFFVKLEGFLALAVEQKIGTRLHVLLLSAPTEKTTSPETMPI
jgi:hypothetical protein